METMSKWKHRPPLCHPERTRISCDAALDISACAAFVKESSIKCANATKFHRKSGAAEGSAVHSTRNKRRPKRRPPLSEFCTPRRRMILLRFCPTRISCELADGRYFPVFGSANSLNCASPGLKEAAEKRVIFLVLSTLCFNFWFLMEVSDGLLGFYLTVWRAWWPGPDTRRARWLRLEPG